MASADLPDAKSLWTAPRLDHLGTAIVCTVAYADVFDYPLTAAEIHRYLVGTAASSDLVNRALRIDRWAGQRLERRAGYYTLAERGRLVDLRRSRASVATRMWPKAVRYGQRIASLPFVRLVALTGALTMGNVDAGDDFDFLIVTETGRLWLTRAIVIGFIVKPASHQGAEICPNYLLSERALAFQEQNLYVAHELSQMIPLTGPDLYRQIRERNGWTRRFLPNAFGPPRQVETSPGRWRPLHALLEGPLRTPLGGKLEHWERTRKIRRFQKLHKGQATASFGPDHCKGHFQSNERRILHALDERLRRLANP